MRLPFPLSFLAIVLSCACLPACSVAVGSATQISLFVIPLLVIIGWGIDQPLSLDYQARGGAGEEEEERSRLAAWRGG